VGRDRVPRRGRARSRAVGRVEDASRRKLTTISFKGEAVGELRDDDADDALLARIAELLSAHVLLGWDTAGEAWDP
jgi:hypothetical protein